MTKWDQFFQEKVKKIFEEKKKILDIGGGLRVLKNRGNIFDPKRAWIEKYLSSVDYQVLDPVPDYNPDIVGDIHKLPLQDESFEAVFCISVLEHIENPFQAFEEMYRILKPGGYCFIYVPFLYCYHAHPGYYGDFWRYTEEALRFLGKKFSKIEIQGVRGPIETWFYLTPLSRFKVINLFARKLDKIFKKENSKQVSGYNVFLIK